MRQRRSLLGVSGLPIVDISDNSPWLHDNDPGPAHWPNRGHSVDGTVQLLYGLI